MHSAPHSPRGPQSAAVVHAPTLNFSSAKSPPPQRPPTSIRGADGQSRSSGVDSPIPRTRAEYEYLNPKAAPAGGRRLSGGSDNGQRYRRSESSSGPPKASPTPAGASAPQNEPQNDWRYKQQQGGYHKHNNYGSSPHQQQRGWNSSSYSNQQPYAPNGPQSQSNNHYRNYQGNDRNRQNASPSPEPKKLDVDLLIQELWKITNVKVEPPVDFTISYEHLEAIILETRARLMKQPMLLELDGPLNICGDIHGQYFDLIRIFQNSQMKPPKANYLFLGDYVDRGKQSLECCALLFLYKIKYPENFFLLRGNHECPGVNRVYGFYDECKRRFDKGNDLRGVKIWKTFIDVFNCLPVSALVGDKILCMHGGLSPELTNLTHIRAIERPCAIPENGLMCDLLWSDPIDMSNPHLQLPDSGWGPNDRGVSFTFTPYVVKDTCRKLNIDLIVRAHQVVEDGYEFFADRRLVTVFSAPNYCGTFDNLAAVLIVDQSLKCQFTTLKPVQTHSMHKRPSRN